jgi:hypothetical protein
MKLKLTPHCLRNTDTTPPIQPDAVNDAYTLYIGLRGVIKSTHVAHNSARL